MSKQEVKPVSPQEIMDNLDTIIPNIVIESVNELLSKGYRGTGPASFKQKDLISLIIAKSRSGHEDKVFTSDLIFENKWLDFESIYTKVGWKVEYEKPDRDESFDAYFKFTKK